MIQLLKSYHARSVRTKISAIVVVSVFCAVLVGAAASAFREAERRFASKKTELNGITATLAVAASRPLAAGNKAELGRALSAIARIPGIAFAQVLDKDGRAIFQLGNSIVLERPDGPLRPNADLTLFSSLVLRNYILEAPIKYEGVEIGTLRVVADISDLRNAWSESIVSALLVGLFAAGLGVLISRRLQSTVTAPIGALTSAMQDIRRSSDYSRKVEKTSDDETGLMVETFNRMLEEIRERDQRLAHHRNRLEIEVEERTADLKRATIAAQAANAAKSDFLATMSHEIRTPLNGMLVMAELLSSGDLPGRLQRHADVIVSSGRTLLAIINDILDLSKIEAGKLDLELIPVEPLAIAEQVMNLFSARAASKNIDIGCYVAPQVPERILADPVRLSQILSNLVNNALKFTSEGSVVLEIGSDNTGERPDGLCRLTFSVTDTGIGIPSDKLDLIFDRFSQADQSTTRKFGGTGIGLSISKRLVAAMGGTIGVKSTLGVGSRFHFSIPINVDAPPATVELTAATGSLVIVAMTSSASRDILVRTIIEAGCGVILMENMKSAEAQTQPVRAILSDPIHIREAISCWHTMLGMDSGKPAPPPLAVIADLGDTRAANALENGEAVEHLLRPVSRSAVLQFLDMATTGQTFAKSVRLARGVADELPQFTGLRVLAADDTAVNREVITEALNRLGVKVVLAGDGQEAFETAKSGPFDLIFMDCSMPVLDGYEATRKIRSWEADVARKPVPIIALTAHVASTTPGTWQSAGMNDHITKPFTLKSLAKCLSTWTETPVATAPAKAVNVSVGRGPDASELVTLDRSILADLMETGGPSGDLVSRVLTLYRVHAPEAAHRLSEAVRTGEAPKIADEAHALKSMCRNIGAVRLGRLLDTIEDSARSNSMDGIGVLAKRVGPELESVLKELQALDTPSQLIALRV